MVWLLRALEFIDLIVCAYFAGIYERLNERITGVQRIKLLQTENCNYTDRS
jgi:hypothetical protein